MHFKSLAVLRAILVISLAGALVPLLASTQESSQTHQVARSKDGKKLFGTSEALRLARVSSPRISADGSRIAYLVAENEMNKDKDQPWKSVTQLWVIPTAGPASAARQFTRGEKSVSNPAWSPDGKILAFTMDAGDDKDAKPQVWFMYADGGEAWQVTKHKSGVRAFQFSPDGKILLLVATVPLSDAEEKRQKEKDDAVVVDHDYKMAQLWTWDIATNQEKQLTKGNFTVSDPRWSPDAAHVTFTTNPTPRLDEMSNQTAWVLDVATGNQRKLADTPKYTHAARWSHDGKSIAFLGTAGPMIYKMDLLVVSADGGQPRNLTSSFDLNAAEPIWSPDGKSICFSTDSRESVHVFAADVAAGTVRQLTDKPGVTDVTDVSENGQTATGLWSDSTHPDDVFRSDLTFASIEAITNQNAWLADYVLAPMEVIRWKSSKDGMEIDGIVTRPVDFDG